MARQSLSDQTPSVEELNELYARLSTHEREELLRAYSS